MQVGSNVAALALTRVTRLTELDESLLPGINRLEPRQRNRVVLRPEASAAPAQELVSGHTSCSADACAGPWFADGEAVGLAEFEFLEGGRLVGSLVGDAASFLLLLCFPKVTVTVAVPLDQPENSSTLRYQLALPLALRRLTVTTLVLVGSDAELFETTINSSPTAYVGYIVG